MKARTRKVLRGASVAALLAVGFGSAPVSAHNAPISASCDGGLDVTLSGYNSDGVNTVRVWIDGLERGGASFGDATSSSYSFGDRSVSHTWRVLVSAWDDPGFATGWSFDTGTRNIGVCSESTDSLPATSQPAVAVTVITAAPTTTAPVVTTAAPTTVPVVVSSTVITTPAVPDTPVSTIIVAQAAPTVPSTTTAVLVPSTESESEGSLPVTGGTDVSALATALLALGGGLALIVATRRPRRARRA